MTKTLTGGLILMVTLLMIGSYYFPDNSAMWLASDNNGANFFRATILITLIGLFFTQPPRHTIFRIALLVLAGGLAGWTWYQIDHYSIYLLDLLVFVQSAIIFTIEALEREPVEKNIPDEEFDPAQQFKKTAIS